MRYKVFYCAFFALLISLSGSNNVKAEETQYEVYDYESSERILIDSFSSYSKALQFYEENIDDFNNLCLVKDDEVIKMEYGTIKFNEEEIEYFSNNKKAKIDGSSIYDALYLDSDEKNVEFLLSGQKGEVSLEEVSLKPYKEDSSITRYSTSNDILYKDIRGRISPFYSYHLPIDDKPEYLSNDKIYYSFDSHFFYESFYDLVDDYRNDTRVNSINEEPYYNYYQYLPIRSYSNYSGEDIEKYFNETLGFKDKISEYRDFNLDGSNDIVNKSQYYGEYDSFKTYEGIYGVNALTLISSSIEESNYGKNLNSFLNNNIFTSFAYDTELERQIQRYKDIDSSIYGQAKYFMSRAFANYQYDSYSGSFIGNMNSGYAKNYSNDPYYGDKVVSNFYLIDKALGQKDKNNYALGIIENVDKLNIYSDEDLATLKYTLRNLKDYSLILLEELDETYKIQLESSESPSYEYNPITQVGYIQKDVIDYILNEDKISEAKFYKIYFDLNGGKLHWMEDVSLYVRENEVPSIVLPTLDGFSFSSWDSKIEAASSDTTYLASYREIDEIKVSNFDSRREEGEYYKYDNSLIEIIYKDRKREYKKLNSNYIYFLEDSIYINYNGLSISKEIDYSNKNEEIRETIKQYLNDIFIEFDQSGNFDAKKYNYIRNNLKEVSYFLDFDEIRKLDAIVLTNLKEHYNYSFINHSKDLSVSGMSLISDWYTPLSILKPFTDTYFLRINDGDSSGLNLIKDVVSAYDFEVEDSIKLSLTYNLRNISQKMPMVISISIENKDINKIYSVYYYDSKSKDLVKCRTVHCKDYIQFIANEEGSYYILSKDSINTYDFINNIENISIINANPDNHLFFIEGAFIIVLGLLGLSLIIIHMELERRQEKVWNDYKKSLLQAGWHHVERPRN